MPTPSEQKALAFVAIVILLGGAVRVLRAGSAPVPTELEQQALAHQASATDSAATRQRTAARQGKHARSIKSRDRRDTLPVVVGGVSSVPPTYARPDRPFARQPFAAGNSSTGFPPPDPRIDTDVRGQAGAAPDTPSGSGRKAPRAPNAPPLDLDVASAADIDRLPYVGPALAKRLVANRDSLGPFRTLEGLRRVKGVGPATLQRLAGLVTFSGGSAPRRAGP